MNTNTTVTSKELADKWFDSLNEMEYPNILTTYGDGALSMPSDKVETAWYNEVVLPWYSNSENHKAPFLTKEYAINKYIMEQQAVSNVPLVKSGIVICNNCKEFHYEGIVRCSCGSTTFSDTHASNEQFIKSVPDAVDSSLKEDARKFRAENDFLCEKTHAFKRDIEFSFEQGANYQKEKDKAIIQSIYDKHKATLLILKDNRSRWEEEKWTDAETIAVDQQITILAAILSDLHIDFLNIQ